VLADELFVHGHIASLLSYLFDVILLIVGVIGGKILPCFLRAFVSVRIFYRGYGMCLLGRTMQPGLTTPTVGMALILFVTHGIWPGLVLLRLWPLRCGVSLLVALFPVAFLLAALVAGTEEYLIVQKYRDTGVGPTARWTVPHHWLAYDREKQRLDGSD